MTLDDLMNIGLVLIIAGSAGVIGWCVYDYFVKGE